MKNANKFFTILFLFCFVNSFIFAHGKKDVEEISVDNLQSWQAKVDLESKTKKKAEKYNIMITAKDLGGNTTIEGPFNIYIDPESDKPIVGITNPSVDMRVVGNLNIVGTCVDDDGVGKVVLILDEGKVDINGENIEKTVQAKGKEFWSYYLDTNELEEGPHTIKVIGYDINGLESNPYVLRWQLDRKQPVTEVKNLGMGQLVSGNVTFQGNVEDGNGIKELYYSTNNGEFFAPVSISSAKESNRRAKNAVCNFSFSVDTRKFPDGPSVLWFKAIDESGSVGYYSFLYFIDNTKPDVQIVYPEEGSVVNGKFSASGFAKDEMDISSLSWTFGNEKGEFELTPGNPYWVIDLDVCNLKEKSKKLVIRAVDNAGNIVEVSKNIAIDPESDKPVASISDPLPGTMYAGDSSPVFVRGFVKDDDRVSKVVVQLDSNEPVEYMTNGAYSYTFCKASDLSAGSHKITVIPFDENNVQGNPVSVQVESKGVAPTFSGASLGGKSFENGMEIHPEVDSSFELVVSAQLGLTSVETKLSGSNINEEKSVELKNAGSYKVVIPVTSIGGRGMMNVEIKATDSIGRVSMYRGFFHVKETSKIKSDKLELIFDDNVFEEKDGILTVYNNPDYPVSGYVIGGNASAVEISPATKFAKAKLVGNQIVIQGGTAVGVSEPVKIRVKTDRNGKVLESKPIVFVNDNSFPQFTAIKANGKKYESNSVDGKGGNVKITGSIECESGIKSVSYRVLSINTELQPTTNLITKITTSKEEEYKKASVSGSSYGINLDTSGFASGYYVVEILAESKGGNKNSTAVLINNVPELQADEKGKIPLPKLYNAWFEGNDLIGVAIYQGEIDKEIQVFSKSQMNVGSNVLSMTVTAGEKENVFKSPSVTKKADVKARFAYFDDSLYYSGMNVILPKDSNKTEKHVLKMYIQTEGSVGSVSYEIYGEDTPGGDNKQSGSAKVYKDESGKTFADIPIGNLPSRVTHIKSVVKVSGAEDTVVNGTLFIVRQKTERSDDAEKVYIYMDSLSNYDSKDGNYVMPSGSQIFYYVNIPTDFTATLSNSVNGLKIEKNGNVVVLTAEKDGNFKDVKIKIKDIYGRVVESKGINILADSEGPNLVIQNENKPVWVKKSLTLKGTAQDALGVRSVEYSIDNGETWKKFSTESGKGVTFSKEIDISSVEDGLVRINIRAMDNAGHTAYENLAVFKDTTPPKPRVIEPLAGDIINGKNLMVFEVQDEGSLNKVYYARGEAKKEISINPLVYTFVGTEDKPVDNKMSFIFVDEAGNSKTLNSWDFKIDNKSDLPVAEIHIPEEKEVLTRNFTISGVVYDDDGNSKIYYKIDNNKYKQVSKNEIYGEENPEAVYEMSSSFEIFVPIEQMTDNEHTITVYAVDQNGVRGEEVKRTFRISLEEPKGSVEKPTIDTSVRDVIEISGVASDKNGIQKVEVSLDNGNSYNDAVGTEKWTYKVDTRAIPGGTQVVFLRITDKYGITGLYSSLINIDNNSPNISLEYPLDDSISTGNLFFSGNAFDNVEITKMYVTIRNMEKSSSPIVRNLKIDRIIGETIDISNLPNGFYNVELTGEDKAGNKTNVSRNIHLDKNKPTASVDILYPLNGEHKNGYFNIYGNTEIQQDTSITQLKLYIDNKVVKETQVSEAGFFKFEIAPPSEVNSGEVDENGNPIKTNRVDMTDGVHKYKVEAVLSNGKKVTSREQTITYNQSGPWITLDNFVYGDFATERPFLKGKAGSILSKEEMEKLNSKETSKEEKALYEAKRTIKNIEISLNNGKTFTEISKSSKWEYRIENQDLPEGYHFLLVRVTMNNGDRAIERTIVQIDNTCPTIRLISPGKGGRYNQVLDVSGLSKDDVKLEDVTISLRKGDKSSYEVPSFIQGLYLDFHVWGATLFEVGAGLTFFDDNVKVQFQWGQFTQSQRDQANAILGKNTSSMRYGGDNIFGVKLLANISQLPFSYFFGRDWDFLYANFAVGAQFSRFNETGSGKPQWLSAIELQIEFPKFVRAKASMFSSFSLYTEASLWFIPSDVSGDSINSKVFQIAFGLRTNIF